MEDKVVGVHLSRSRVSGLVVPAVRASSKSGSLVPVEVVEPGSIQQEVLFSWEDYSVRARNVKEVLSVVSLTNHEGVGNSSLIMLDITIDRELDTCKHIVGCLEVVEPDVGYCLSNGSVSLVFPANKSIEVGSDQRVLVVRVGGVEMIVDYWFARVLTWNKSMEDSQSVSSI